MDSEIRKNIIFYTFLLASMACLFSAIFAFVSYGEEIPNDIEGKLKSLLSQSDNYSEELDKALNIPEKITEELNASLMKNESKPDPNFVESELNKSIRKYSEIFGVGVAFEPGIYNLNGSGDKINSQSNQSNQSNQSVSGPDLSGLYAPTYSRKNGDSLLYQAAYDYTKPRVNESDPHTEWYIRARDEGAGWNEPYFGTRSNTYIFEYSKPLQQNNSTLGVVYASYSRDGLRKLVGGLDFTDTGYFFIVWRESSLSCPRILYHPIPEYFNKEIGEISPEDDLKLKELWERVESEKNNSDPTESGKFSYQIIKSAFNKDESDKKTVLSRLSYYTGHYGHIFKQQFNCTKKEGNISFVDHNPFTSQESLVIARDMDSNNTIVMVFPIEEIFREYEDKEKELDLRFTLSLLFFFLFLIAAFITRFWHGSGGLWILAVLSLILFAAGIGYIWHLNSEGASGDDFREGNIIIYNKEGLESILDSDRESYAIRVPLGIYLKSIEFSSANNVIVTGYIWQRHPASGDLFSGKEPIIFPEAKELTIEKAYSDSETTGWHFEALLRQQFDYSDYPFDNENVWVRLWPNTFDRNVILVPDLDSYSTLDPEKKPGLERNIPVEGWQIRNSYFSYRRENYSTNFGIDNYRGIEGYSDLNNSTELYFNVEMRRNLIGPIISNLLPVFVVAVLLFIVLLITTKNEKKKLFGFSSSGILAYCASLFFTLIVSHASLRSKIPTAGLIYIEKFYFVMYFAILLVSLNSIAFASHVKIGFIDAKDNLYVKILYWPLIMGMLLLLTLKNFY